jgi:hypothetical protein
LHGVLCFRKPLEGLLGDDLTVDGDLEDAPVPEDQLRFDVKILPQPLGQPGRAREVPSTGTVGDGDAHESLLSRG